MKNSVLLFSLVAVCCLCAAAWRRGHYPQVGKTEEQGTLVATGQFLHPVGTSVGFHGRPVDLVVSQDGRYAYLKETAGLTVVDCNGLNLVRQIKIPGGDSYFGMALSADGKTLCYTTSKDSIVVFDVDGADLSERKTIKLPAARVGGAPHPCGIVFQDPSHVIVCLNRDNAVARVDLASGSIETWNTDVAPFAVALDSTSERLYVSCWSRKANGTERAALSSGTSVPVDARGVGLGGRLTVIDLRTQRPMGSIPIGHHPAEVDLVGKLAYVPCSGSDTIEQLSTVGRGRKTLSLFPNQPIGAAPTSIAFDPDRRTAYVTCSGRNSVLVYDLSKRRILGEYPTLWYPTTVRLVQGTLYVACAKGIGERSSANPKSHNSWDLMGALCLIKTSETPQPLAYVPPPPARPGMAAVAMPERSGEPSLINHVVYVIRENRSYDQVFGDMKEGDGDRSLCNFGEIATPNAHALAREYALLDNYYCNGICSADGHSWATEGNTTANLERSVSSWPRSYPFGDDALNTSSTGFLWDEVLAAHKSFINFGEFDYAATANKETYFDCLKEHYAGTSKIQFKQNIGVARMRQYSARGYPGWDLSIPDVLRADIFVRALKQMEAKGKMPDLTVLYLCCDHTGGPVTPGAQVADNDLATGMCVEALTKSKFWKDTCVFVEEDDPQAGWDHVDGHRSPCLVISPYSRHLGRIDDFFNQTSVIRSIEQIFGLRTRSRFVSISPVMFSCFAGKFDDTPYTARPNQIPLDQITVQGGMAGFDFSKPDLVDEKKFNRAIWAQTMPGKKYPAEFEGAHGKGLAARGLASVDGSGLPDRD